MGVDYRGRDMTSHPQYITVRNKRGQRMLDTVKSHLQVLPTMQVLGPICPCLGTPALCTETGHGWRGWLAFVTLPDAVRRLATGAPLCCRQSLLTTSKTLFQAHRSSCKVLRCTCVEFHSVAICQSPFVWDENCIRALSAEVRI